MKQDHLHSWRESLQECEDLGTVKYVVSEAFRSCKLDPDERFSEKLLEAKVFIPGQEAHAWQICHRVQCSNQQRTCVSFELQLVTSSRKAVLG